MVRHAHFYNCWVLRRDVDSVRNTCTGFTDDSCTRLLVSCQPLSGPCVFCAARTWTMCAIGQSRTRRFWPADQTRSIFFLTLEITSTHLHMYCAFGQLCYAIGQSSVDQCCTVSMHWSSVNVKWNWNLYLKYVALFGSHWHWYCWRQIKLAAGFFDAL